MCLVLGFRVLNVDLFFLVSRVLGGFGVQDIFGQLKLM